jgi:hypothetical protein
MSGYSEGGVLKKVVYPFIQKEDNLFATLLAPITLRQQNSCLQSGANSRDNLFLIPPERHHSLYRSHDWPFCTDIADER